MQRSASHTRWLLGAAFVLLAGVLTVATVTARPASAPTMPVQTVTSASTTVPATAPATVPPAGSYTMADVRTHNSASSCWTAINGKVYDVTNWISQHPGGSQVILMLCGTDGSSAFNAQHGGQSRPESELANFYKGPLSS